jgi:hypothetical protein
MPNKPTTAKSVAFPPRTIAGPIDAIVPNAVCEYYTLDNPAPGGTTCHVVRGAMTLYLRESDPASSALQSVPARPLAR